MSDEDGTIFNKGDKPNDSGDNPKVSHEDLSNDQLLSLIVDEDGKQKYATVAEAFKGLAHAQSYIKQLHGKIDETGSDNQRLKEELAKANTAAEVLEKLQGANNGGEPRGGTEPKVSGLDVDEAKKLFESLLDERSAKGTRTKNENAVMSALTEKFGEKAEDAFKAKAAELNLSIEDFNNLSGTSPTAVLAYFNTTSKDTGFEILEPGETIPKGNDEVITFGNFGKSVLTGATTADVKNERSRVVSLVEEVHAQGKTIDDMTDPKVYFETFGKRPK